ncbi:ubiquitin-protein transferase [Aureococcus anophagefferens]|nr:ubiquitin-protein transferase [Aureococcus anophagefferens]
MAEIEGLVRALREGDDAAKTAAARALGNLIHNDTAYAWVAIPEAGGIPPLVDLLRDGSADAQFEAAGALCSLACYDENTQALIAEAGAIRCSSTSAPRERSPKRRLRVRCATSRATTTRS